MPLKTKILIGVSAVLAMSAGFWLSSIQQENTDDKFTDARANFSPIQGSVLSPARKIAVPALVKDNGQTFTIDDLTGQWHLLFFGYTHCPDICPTTMGALAQAKKMAEADGLTFPGVVFVSVDPERDKVEMLGQYVRYFDTDFTGVTGDPSLIQALALQMSVVYMKMPAAAGSDTEGYLVDHSSSLLLLNPEGRLQAFLNPPHEPTIILRDVQKVTAQN
jgi:protein SCO1/2